MRKKELEYQGFEQGPIRPPSEAYSLLIRITRNCPWNHCAFCGVYKGTRFSIRPVDHVIRDIDEVYRYVKTIMDLADENGNVQASDIQKAVGNITACDLPPFQAAYNWMAGGMQSVFLQDANSLIIKPADLMRILEHLKMRFPWVKRITSYARSHTIARISDDDLAGIRSAGLNRIHIGLESASDEVLKMMKKGVTKADHIKAGRKAKRAGIELSEYVMPGLGGRKQSRVHALETADALNRINPDFIRIRTLALPGGIPLLDEVAAGRFEKPTDTEMILEIYTMIDALEGIDSTIVSDHILNMFQEVEGKLPKDKDRVLGVLQMYLDMDPDEQCLYQVGRRLGYFTFLADLKNPELRSRVEQRRERLKITPENVDDVLNRVTQRFV
ncbi:MAG: radical SAM protein [Desulfobacterales bacterium]